MTRNPGVFDCSLQRDPFVSEGVDGAGRKARDADGQRHLPSKSSWLRLALPRRDSDVVRLVSSTGTPCLIEDVSVDHRPTHVVVTEEFPDRPSPITDAGI